jgi:hypothetical protein
MSDRPFPREQPGDDSVEQSQGQTPKQLASFQLDAFDAGWLESAREAEILFMAGQWIGEATN